MLVHHTDSQLMGIVRASNLADARPDDNITGVWQVISHDAFDEGAFPSSIFAQEGVKSARLKFQGDRVIRDKRSKAFRQVDQLEARRLKLGGRFCHAIAAIKDSE